MKRDQILKQIRRGIFTFFIIAYIAILRAQEVAFLADQWRYDSSYGKGSANPHYFSDIAQKSCWNQGNIYVDIQSGAIDYFGWGGLVLKFDLEESIEKVSRGVTMGPFGEYRITMQTYNAYRTDDYQNHRICVSKSGSNGWFAYWIVYLDHPVYSGYYPDDDVVAMIVDGSGNIYLSVVYRTSKVNRGSSECVTVKLRASDGAELWRRTFGDNDYPNDMVMDQEGNVYVTGSAGTVKYNANGEEQFTCNVSYTSSNFKTY